MTPDEFLTTFVEGNYEDFAEKPESIRRAFNAVVAASHMADHYFEYTKRHEPAKVDKYKKLDDYIQYLFQSAGENFRDIRSIANAYKHLYIKSHWSISSAGSIDCVQFKSKTCSVEAVEQDWGSSPEIESTTTKVIYRRRNGTQGDLLQALTQARDFWLNELYGKSA